jgi:WD40 repeat protein
MGMCVRFLKTESQFCVACCYESGSLLIWDLLKQDSPLIYHKQHLQDPILSFAFSVSLETVFLVGASESFSVVRFAQTNWNFEDEKQITLPSRGVNRVEIRADQKLVSLACWDHRVRLYSTKSFKPLAILKHHTKTVQVLAVPTYPSNLIASGGSDGHIAIWAIY